jgi:hypothetical protein
MTNIPILEGEEMWAQEAIDSGVKYKVTYYADARESYVKEQWFATFKEATDFAIKHNGDTLEIKRYEK